MTILSATGIYEFAPSGGSHLLMEGDSSQSLVAAERGDKASPGRVLHYLHEDLARLDKSPYSPGIWLASVQPTVSSQVEHLLNRWTRLRQIDTQIEEAGRESRVQQRESRQPMVESDEEDEYYQRRKLAGAGTRMSASSRRSTSIEPLFSDANALPTPARDLKYGPTAPLSPAASPHTSRSSLGVPFSDLDSPVSPRSSITSLPVEAAAAVEAKEEDEDLDLEIPWQLCTRKHFWKYVDGKMVGSNTDQLPSVAFLERNSWTEIMASWVCKEAIREAGYKVTQVQKDVRDGRRTKFETCFCIERPLQFEQVKKLVERTVEIYRQRKPPSPPPQARRSSFNRPPPPPLKVSRPNEIDRDRTPRPSKTHPSVGRTASSRSIPPPLERSVSTPGPGYGQGFQQVPIPHPSNLHIPMPPGPYSTSVPQNSYAESQHASWQQQQAQMYNSPQGMYTPNPSFNTTGVPPHVQQAYNIGRPQSPLRQSFPRSSKSKYEEEVSTTDSDSAKDRRRRRSKSRSRHVPEPKKKSNKSKAAGVLMGVGGLTALLDGLSGL